jgi:hypothetical protein
MSRSDYSEDIEHWQLVMWRGAVKKAIRGARGQAFLREMIRALEALPEKKLVASELDDGELVCAVGAVGRARGIDMTGLDPENHDQVADKFGIANAMAREIFYMNDEWHGNVTPEQRYVLMLSWAVENLDPAYDREEA